jgi:hypothetical protein
MNSLPTWATWSIAVAAVFSPVLAFLMAIAAEILISLLKDAVMPALLALVVAAASWSLFRKLWVGPRGRAPVET